MVCCPHPNLDDRDFQDSGRRRQAAGPAALPDLDRPQRLRPGRHADRGVRPDGRPADLPAEPGAGPALRQVPRADRAASSPAGRGARRGRRSGCRRRSPRPVLVRAETQVATPRTDVDEPVVFTTSRGPDDRAVRVQPGRRHRPDGAIDRPHARLLGRGRRLRLLLRRAACRRRAADRAVRGRAVLRGAAADGLPGRRHRRRPARPAAGLGGVDRLAAGAPARSTGTRPAG